MDIDLTKMMPLLVLLIYVISFTCIMITMFAIWEIKRTGHRIEKLIRRWK